MFYLEITTVINRLEKYLLINPHDLLNQQLTNFSLWKTV